MLFTQSYYGHLWSFQGINFFIHFLESAQILFKTPTLSPEKATEQIWKKKKLSTSKSFWWTESKLLKVPTTTINGDAAQSNLNLQVRRATRIFTFQCRHSADSVHGDATRDNLSRFPSRRLCLSTSLFQINRIAWIIHEVSIISAHYTPPVIICASITRSYLHKHARISPYTRETYWIYPHFIMTQTASFTTQVQTHAWTLGPEHCRRAVNCTYSACILAG